MPHIKSYMFQFLYGAIQTRIAVFKHQNPELCNSCMVRFKLVIRLLLLQTLLMFQFLYGVIQLTNAQHYPLFGSVSIFLWCRPSLRLSVSLSIYSFNSFFGPSVMIKAV